MEEADTQREEPVEEEALEEGALEEAVPPAPKRRGRPVGSKNKIKVVIHVVIQNRFGQHVDISYYSSRLP